MAKGNLINGILCCLNPIFPISKDHYVCGSNLVLFTSIAQIENCLTGFTNTCKSLTDKNCPNNFLGCNGSCYRKNTSRK